MKKQKRAKDFTVSGEEMIKRNLFMAAVAFGLALLPFVILLIAGIVKAILL